MCIRDRLLGVTSNFDRDNFQFWGLVRQSHYLVAVYTAPDLSLIHIYGCLSSELSDKAHQDLCLDRCGLDEIRKKALYHVTPDYSISMLHEWRKDGTNIRYLAEATPDTADYINGLLRMHAVDEIILYTVPFISGSGRHFFKSALPEQHWTLSSLKSYSNGVCRIIYILDKKAR